MKCAAKKLGLGVLAAWAAFGQSAAPEPEFEVASVKRAIPGPQGVWTNGSPDRILAGQLDRPVVDRTGIRGVKASEN